jgi:hypothetical protein
MERQQKITKLTNVLRKTAWSLRDDPSADIVEQATGQYNRVLNSLAELDPEVSTLFVPLGESTTGGVVAAACRQLAAYFKDEVRTPDLLFDPDSFKDFWAKSAEDLEQLGDFIRESIEKMQEKKGKRETSSNGSSD